MVADADGAGLYLEMLNLIAINTLGQKIPAYMGGTGAVWRARTILRSAIGALMLNGAALVFTIRSGTLTGAIYSFTVLIVSVAGLTSQIGYIMTFAKTPPHKVVMAMRFINITQAEDFIIALSIFGAMFQNFAFIRLDKTLSPLGFSAYDFNDAFVESRGSFLCARG